MKKVIVTGGAGYIGSHTVVELIDAGYTPIIVDDFSNSSRKVLAKLTEITDKEITLYEGKVQEEGLLDRIYSEQGQIEACIHFAAFKAVGESVQKPLAYYENNLGSTLALLNAMMKHGTKKLVFSSSCTVYGQPDKLPVTESTPRKAAESPYGNTKQICEDIISDTVASGSKLQAVSLRYFNPIGAHSSALIGELPLGVPANLVPFITQTATGKRDHLTVFGNDYNTTDGTCVRDYIHVCDLAAAHVKAINYLDSQSADSFYDLFNVGIGTGSTVLEVIKSFEKVNQVSLNYKIGERRAGDVEKIYADNSKALSLLGWKAERDLSESLESAWRWEKNLAQDD